MSDLGFHNVVARERSRVVNTNDTNNRRTSNYRPQTDVSSNNTGLRGEILSWLSSLNFHDIHREIFECTGLTDRDFESDDNAYTGKWLLDSPVLRKWQAREITELWYTGMPGTGKSTLVSIVIDRMAKTLEKFSPRDRRGKLAYVYFQVKNREHYRIDQILGSVIQQIIRGYETVPRIITDIYHDFDQTGPHEKRTTALADAVHELSTNEAIYVVLDGLDESDDELSKDLIRLLTSRGRPQSRVSLLVTSRIWKEFYRLSEGFHRQTIGGNRSDLQLFIDHRFKSHPSLQRFGTEFPEIEKEFKNLIAQKSQGIFLWVSIVLQNIGREIESTSPGHGDLPNVLDEWLRNAVVSDLDELYAGLSARIVARKEKNLDGQRAYRILAWVVLSPQPLSINELREAMAYDSVTKNLGDPGQEDVQKVIGHICHGVVTFHEDRIRLVHSTAEVYFSQNADQLLLKRPIEGVRTRRHGQIFAAARFPNLGSDSVDREIEADGEELGYDIKHVKRQLYYAAELLERFPLLPYAVRYLGYHIRQHSGPSINDEMDREVIALLEQGPKMAFLYRWLGLMNLIQPESHRRTYKFQELTSVAIYPDLSMRATPTAPSSTLADRKSQGHGSFAESPASSGSSAKGDGLRNTENVLDSRSGTTTHPRLISLDDEDNGPKLEPMALILAADSLRNRPFHPDRDQILAPTSKIPRSTPATTATHIAAWYGYIPVLRHFLEAEENVNTADEFNRRPIVVALQQGHTDAVRICLEKGAQIDLMSTEGEEILIQFCRRHDVESGLVRCVVEQNYARLDILQRDTSHGKNSWLQIPMLVTRDLAGRFGETVVKALQITDYASSITKIFRGPILDDVTAAIWHKDASTLSRIRAKGELSGKDKNSRLGRMPIFAAVEFGYLDTVILLIDSGVDVDIQDPEGNTPLIRASFRGNVAMVKELLNRNANVAVRNRKGITAWSVRLEPGNETVLKLLEDAGGLDPDAIDESGCPALYTHAAHGNLRALKWLLDKGINPSIRTNFSWAPLHRAAFNGHTECVEELLREGAEHSPISDNSQTPLDMAMRQGHKKIVQALREAGAVTGRELYASSSSSGWDQSLPRRSAVPPLRISKSTIHRVHGSTEKEEAPAEPMRLPPPPSFDAKLQEETVGCAPEQQQNNISPSPAKQPGVADNVTPFKTPDSRLGLIKAEDTSAEPDAVAKQSPRQSPPRNNELGCLTQETDRHILDQGTHPTEAGDYGWTHESWEETPPTKQLTDPEYFLRHTSWIISAIDNSFQRGVEFAAGTKLSWWPLPDPEEEPSRGFTRVYSLRCPQTWPWKTRRFYDDIPTPSAERLFSKLAADHCSSEESLRGALDRTDIVLRNTTLMHVLQQFENGKGVNSENQTPRSAGTDAAVHNDKRGKELQETLNRDEKGQEPQHPVDESDQDDGGRCPRESGTILYVTADIKANESVSCTVNLGEDDKTTLSNLYKAFRALPSGRWKRATGMKFYRFQSFHFKKSLGRRFVTIHKDQERYPKEAEPGYESYHYMPRPWKDGKELPCQSGEAWYFFNNPDECCTSTQLNRSLPIRFEDTGESRIVAWGIHIEQRYSVLVILVPVFVVTGLTLVGTLWFIPHWLGTHKDDLQNATVPATLALGVVQFVLQFLVSLIVFRWSI